MIYKVLAVLTLWFLMYAVIGLVIIGFMLDWQVITSAIAFWLLSLAAAFVFHRSGIFK